MSNFVLTDPVTATSLTLTHVIADSFRDEYETAEIALLGRGRRFEFGTRWGFNGTLTVQLYDTVALTARAQRLALVALKELGSVLTLTTPYGDTFNVNVGDIQIDRIAGVGDLEYCTATIPYMEVS